MSLLISKVYSLYKLNGQLLTSDYKIQYYHPYKLFGHMVTIGFM